MVIVANFEGAKQGGGGGGGVDHISQQDKSSLTIHVPLKSSFKAYLHDTICRIEFLFWHIKVPDFYSFADGEI